MLRARMFGGLHERLRPHAPGTRLYCAWALIGDLAYSRQLGSDLRWWLGYWRHFFSRHELREDA